MSNKIASIERARKRQQAKDGEISVSLANLINCALRTEQNPFPALYVLMGRDEIPIRQSLLIGRIAKRVSEELEEYQAAHKKLLDRYVQKDDKGNLRILDAEGKPVSEGESGRYDIPAEQLVEFEREYQELISTEVTIPGAKIKANDLMGVRIAPAQAMNLEWLIE